MHTSCIRQPSRPRLRWPGAAIKLSFVLFCAAGAIWADASQPCPPLRIEAACSATGTASLTLRPGPDAPADLAYLVSLPDEGVGAISLAPGASLTLDLPAPTARQITVAVVGLEPDGGGLAACCLSNQRLHLPAPCAPAVPDQGAAPDDLAMDLTLDPLCTRQRAAAVCQGTLAVTGTGADRVQVTLSADMGESLAAAGAECSAFARGQAQCRVPTNTPLPFNLALAANAPQGTVTLCAETGIGADETARTLALQQALTTAGYPVGGIDGQFGPATGAALAAFVADAGLPPLGDSIPPAVLALLGIADAPDARPENNRACAVATVPAAPLICDAATTRASGDTCACRFKGMTRVSARACACPKGQTLGAKGCRATGGGGTGGGGTPDTGDTTATAPNCDPATTVLRDGICQCRSAAMLRVSDTTCTAVEIRFCPDGSPQSPGLPCPPTCSRFNAAGECCDDLGPEDASCR